MRRQTPHLAVAFTRLPDGAAGRIACAHAEGRAEVQPPGAACRRTHSSRCAWPTTSFLPTTRIPTAWSEIGWGGPASPRGYVRMDFDDAIPGRRPKQGGRVEAARRKNRTCRMTRLETPRAANGRAPDVFRPGGWIPMREYGDDEPVDFAIVGTGAGGGTLACRLAEARLFGRRASTPALISGRWRISPPTKREQAKLYWTDERIVDGDNPLQHGQQQQRQGGWRLTVHFAMVSLRFRPEWFKSRSLLGYGADWPLDWREMWDYYARGRAGAEDLRPGQLSLGAASPALSVPRARAQCRGPCACAGLRGDGHQMDGDAAGDVLGAARAAHPCVYRGFCVTGCSTNAKQSALVTWIPRAIAPARKSAILRWSAGSRSTTTAGRPACTITARQLAVSARPQRRGRRLCDRDAAAAAELRDRPLSRRSRQLLRASSART